MSLTGIEHIRLGFWLSQVSKYTVGVASFVQTWFYIYSLTETFFQAVLQGWWGWCAPALTCEVHAGDLSHGLQPGQCLGLPALVGGSLLVAPDTGQVHLPGHSVEPNPGVLQRLLRRGGIGLNPQVGLQCPEDWPSQQSRVHPDQVQERQVPQSCRYRRAQRWEVGWAGGRLLEMPWLQEGYCIFMLWWWPVLCTGVNWHESKLRILTNFSCCKIGLC